MAAVESLLRLSSAHVHHAAEAGHYWRRLLHVVNICRQYSSHDIQYSTIAWGVYVNDALGFGRCEGDTQMNNIPSLLSRVHGQR